MCRECAAIGKKCDNCSIIRHFTNLCKKSPKINQVTQQHAPDTTTDNDGDATTMYNINIFRVDTEDTVENSDTVPQPPVDSTSQQQPSEPSIESHTVTQPLDESTHQQQPSETDTTSTLIKPTPQDKYTINIYQAETPKNKVLPSWRQNINSDFRATVVVNNTVSKPLADTGARVSVCGTVQAKRWNLLQRMVPSTVKLKPYNSSPIPVLGVSRCAVTFGSTSVPVEWHIISGSCEPILDGNSALRLGIITFNCTAGVFHPVLMVDSEASESSREQIQDLLQNYQHIFDGLGRLKNHKVKLHVKPDSKPIRDAPRTVPYHLSDRSWNAVQGMLKQGVIEPHPVNEPAPWVSNVVFQDKDDGDLRVTMDARNVNEAIQSSNLPIPKQEDIKVKLAHKRYFSKLDFKSAFWQLELAQESRYLTVFQIFDQFYRYVVLTMGLKPAQGELNAALNPLFAHIRDVHVIHDDVVVATDTSEEHLHAINELLEAISKAGLTLNPKNAHSLQRKLNSGA